MIFDTDVLIWYMRSNEKAIRLLDETPDRCLSVITYMELLQGARDKQEALAIRVTLTNLAFQMLPLTENIGNRASIYMEQYGLRTALAIPDALVAATAAENAMPLCSSNLKHYKSIRDLDLKVFRP